MHKQIEKFNKKLETLKKNQTEILKLKNTMTGLKNSKESFNKRIHHSEEKNRQTSRKVI